MAVFCRLQEDFGLFPEDVQIANRPQGIAGGAQAFDEGSQVFGIEVGAEDLRGSAHAAGRHPHIVQGFVILAEARGGFEIEHALEMEEEGLARRLGQCVLGGNAGTGRQGDGFGRARLGRQVQQVGEKRG